MNTGNVIVDPELKNVITKSSIESANASNAAETTPGMINGSVTSRKVSAGVAPRSCAASSSERSKPIRRERTVMTTNDRQNMMCAIRIVANPRAGVPAFRNSDSSAAPRTTSGVASGMKMKKLTGARPLNS